MSSPTQRSLALLRERGYMVGVVEKWNMFAKIRQDLFGILDLVAIGNGQTVGVQTTSASNISARIKKIAESEATPILRKSGWILLVHGWKKVGNRWQIKEVDVS